MKINSYIDCIIKKNMTSKIKKDTALAEQLNAFASGSTTEFDLYQENPESNCYELVFEDGEELTAKELMALNAAGYIYHSSQYDIEYEDEYPVYGGIRIRHMDIHYFAKVAEGTFTDCLPI